jgi:hypothetical protein
MGAVPNEIGGYTWYVAFDADQVVVHPLSPIQTKAMIEAGFEETNFKVVGEVEVDDSGYVVEIRFGLNQWAEEAARQLGISGPAYFQLAYEFWGFGEVETSIDPCAVEGRVITESSAEGVLVCS